MIGFGNLVRERIEEIEDIKSLNDTRLTKIDPTSDGFFENVLGYVPKKSIFRFFNKEDAIEEMSKIADVMDFINAVKEVKQANLGAFYRPIMDPSIIGEKIFFKQGEEPAVGYSYNDWKKFIKKMTPVDGKNWCLGTEYQYYAFLVDLINRLVKSGWKTKKAINAVVLDSIKLGNYSLYNKFENTGLREICGYFDLANTNKILNYTNNQSVGFWYAGGNYCNGSKYFPLATLKFYREQCDYGFNYGVAWIIIE